MLKADDPWETVSLCPGPLRTAAKKGIIIETVRPALHRSSVTERKNISMERAEIISQILAILEDVAEVSPEDVNEVTLFRRRSPRLHQDLSAGSIAG